MYDYNLKIDEKVRNHQYQHKGRSTLLAIFKTLRYGGAIMAPLVTSVFLKVEGQNLVAWGIFMCLLQKWH